jgi:cell division protein FtsN
MKYERGGTIIGFILGVVVGLGIALAVAVYVTKVPIPFMNKGQSRSADQNEAEAQKNKNWDPNAMLYGKNPAPIAAASEASKGKVDAKVDPKADPKAAAKPVDTKAEVKPAVSADPLGDLAKAKAGTADATDAFVYFVQVGAFRTAEDAESQRAKLSLSGIETKISEREQSGRPVFRVRVGPFDKKEEADKAKDKMDKSGLETAMVRVPR